MRSRKPKQHNEFDQLIDRTIQTRVENLNPRDRVWKRIRQNMQRSQPQQKIWWRRSSLVVQAVMLLMMLVYSQAGWQQMSNVLGTVSPVTYVDHSGSEVAGRLQFEQYTSVGMSESNRFDRIEQQLFQQQQQRWQGRNVASIQVDTTTRRTANGSNPHNAQPYGLLFIPSHNKAPSTGSDMSVLTFDSVRTSYPSR